MSAIAGIYYLDNRPVDRSHLESMVDILVHRGTDASNIWHQGSIGLAHRMLWTTPESLHEQLPFKNHNLVITADARIDNRDELIAALDLNDYPTQKITDSQLILASYQKWGDHCLEKLLGDFAFAIWDERSHQLFCAKDPMGVKPFYYYRSKSIFVFASEIKALLCLPEVPRQLNEVKVADHLALLFEDQTITFYKDILRLQPAHTITIDANQTKLARYWSLDPNREIHLRSDAEYTEAFREIFIQAVRCRLRSAFPISSTLSGGLDSSSIACTARKLLTEAGNQNLHTFSAIFPNLPKEDLQWLDERRYINAVKALGGLQSHDVPVDCFSPLVKLLWQDDEAIAAPNLYMHQALYHAAHQQGVRVFLDGLDGDSTVSHGWAYLTQLTYTGKWRTLFNQLKSIAKQYKVPRRRLLWKYSLRPFWQILPGSSQPPNIKLLNSTFAQRIGIAERMQFLQRMPTFNARLEHWRGLTSGLHSYALEVADKATAAFSLEARYPFYDRRLIQFCLALPPEQKLNQGWTRLVLRQAMTDILPPEVQWRVHKANLAPNFKRKLQEYEKETLKEVINNPQIITPYVDVQAIQAAYNRYSSQPQQSNQDAIALFSAVTLALWLQKAHLTS